MREMGNHTIQFYLGHKDWGKKKKKKKRKNRNKPERTFSNTDRS